VKRVLQLVIFTLPLGQAVFSQHLDDTLNIKTVEVLGIVIPKAYKTTTFDSLTKENASNLADLVHNNSGAFIKSYGAGSLASISFRGTGAAHTQVLWNGISLNSPMNGQIDFSLYPTLFFDEAELHHGASGLIDGAGALGGSVVLNNREEYNNQKKISFKQSLGSFSNYSSALKIKYGNEKWFYETQLFGKSDQNNYAYTNTSIVGNPKDTVSHAANQQFGFQQAIYRKLKNKTLGGRIWYFKSDRQLPGLMTSTTLNDETQQDESLRAILALKGIKNNFQYQITTGIVHEKLQYKNPQANINSKNSSSLIDNNINTSLFLTQNWKIISRLNVKYESARADNFLQQNKRIRSSWLLGVHKDFKQLSVNAFNRILSIGKEISSFAPGVGVQYQLFTKEELFLKANAGINDHFPTFNDLFWNPGGNPDLQPEHAKMLEAGFSYSKTIKKMEFNTAFTLFNSNVDNWIVWLPTAYGYWSPTNLKSVENKGIETKLSITTRLNKIKLKASANYAYTKSTNLTAKNEFDNSLDQQLIYVPFHKLNSSIQVHYKTVDLIYTYSYTGKRFITTDNNWYLPANFLSDISIAKAFTLGKKWKLYSSFKIKNILDQNYQSIAWRPMPGRHYLITVTFKFNS
jgi:iron complex outermembrane receptor protein